MFAHAQSKHRRAQILVLRHKSPLTATQNHRIRRAGKTPSFTFEHKLQLLHQCLRLILLETFYIPVCRISLREHSCLWPSGLFFCFSSHVSYCSLLYPVLVRVLCSTVNGISAKQCKSRVTTRTPGMQHDAPEGPVPALTRLSSVPCISNLHLLSCVWSRKDMWCSYAFLPLRSWITLPVLRERGRQELIGT